MKIHRISDELDLWLDKADLGSLKGVKPHRELKVEIDTPVDSKGSPIVTEDGLGVYVFRSMSKQETWNVMNPEGLSPWDARTGPFWTSVPEQYSIPEGGGKAMAVSPGVRDTHFHETGDKYKRNLADIVQIKDYLGNVIYEGR